MRKLNIQKYLAGNPPRVNTVVPTHQEIAHSSLRNKSIFNPPIKDNKHIDVFKKIVLDEVKDLKIKKREDPKFIKNGIRKLIKRRDIVIRPADKGGGIVILSKEQYHKSMTQMLDDTKTYTKLLKNPVFSCRKALEQIVHLGVKKLVLNKKEARFLIPDSCRTPVIYLLPKIHKNRTDPPPRPIVNSIDSLTSRMGQYIDTFLQPAVQKTEAYLRDTKQMLQIIENFQGGDKSWVMATADVSSLYTVIPHHRACEAAKWGLRKFTDLPCIQRKFLIKCLEFSLKNNYFWYNKAHYHQQTGVAMGARFAPSIAGLFMAK